MLIRLAAPRPIHRPVSVTAFDAFGSPAWASDSTRETPALTSEARRPARRSTAVAPISLSQHPRAPQRQR